MTYSWTNCRLRTSSSASEQIRRSGGARRRVSRPQPLLRRRSWRSTGRRSRQVPPGAVGDRHDRLSPGSRADRACPLRSLERPRVGYLARLAPEKGLHVLVDAFIRLKQMPDISRRADRRRLAGQTPSRRTRRRNLPSCTPPGLGDAYRYSARSIEARKCSCSPNCICSPSRPSTGTEGALCPGITCRRRARGPAESRRIPGIARSHRRRTTCAAQQPDALAAALHELLLDHPTRRQLAAAGRTAVHERYNARRWPEQTLSRPASRSSLASVRYANPAAWTTPASNVAAHRRGRLTSARSCRSSAARAAGEESRLCRIRPTAG